MARGNTLYVTILGDASSVEKAFKKTTAGAKDMQRSIGGLDKAGTVGASGFKKLAGSVGLASGAFLGGAGFLFAAKSVISAASTIQEETEKTGVVFGDSAGQVQAWAKTLTTSFGISEGEALKSTGVFGNMFHSLHIGQSDAARMSERLVTLAADMASFNNASPEDTLAALQSGLAGQVRPLRQFGVFLSQDRIKQEALSSGIAKNASHLDAQQKLQAAYNIILKDTALQQGDVARNTGSLSVAESKLKAAIQNTEAVIGAAFLPSLTKVVNKMAAWLGKTENQKRIQHDLTVSLDTATSIFTTFADAVQGVADAYKNLNFWATKVGLNKGLLNMPIFPGRHGGSGPSLRDLFNKIPGHNKGLLELLGVSGPGGGSGIAPSFKSGQSTEDRVFGHAAGGPASVVAAISGTGGTGALGFKARFAKLENALARAELTQTKKDDRALLVAEVALIRQRATKVKKLKDQTALLQQAVGLQNQIDAIDSQAASDKKSQEDKVAAAKKKALAAAKARAAKEKAQDAKEIAVLKQREKTVKAQIKAIQGRFKDQLDAARQGIGDLFAGPILQPTTADRHSLLGGHAATSNIKSLTADLHAQVTNAAAFQRDINTLIKRGAPTELIKELRAQGVASAPQVHALATGTATALKAFLVEFGKREKLALTTTNTVMKSQLVTLHADEVRLTNLKQEIILHNHVSLDGKSIGVTRSQVNFRHAQSRGRFPGIGPVLP